MKPIEIAGHTIGPGQPCFIIAEAGVNHNGSLELARRMVDVAAEAGADAIKFQTFRADRLVTPTAPKARYQMATTDTAETQYEMLRRLELSEEAHVALLDYCRAQGITFLSTPFDEGSADFLAALDVPALKIPSGEITNLPLLAHLARKGKPLILSTGMSTLGEVETALDAIRAAGNRDVIVLHCVSSYPASAGDVNLLAMRTLELAFGLPVGYSDHTMGAEVAFAAIALGACVLEKHFTLDRSAPGPDQQASLLPQELVELVRGVRSVESALGTGIKTPAGSEWETRSVARKSLVAEVDIEPGTVITALMVGTKRPGTGIPPAMLAGVIGRTARANIPSGTLLGWEMLQ